MGGSWPRSTTDGPIHLIDRATLQHLATLPTPGPIQPPPEVQLLCRWGSAGGDRGERQCPVRPDGRGSGKYPRDACCWSFTLLQAGGRIGCRSIPEGASSPRPPLWKGVSLRSDLWDVSSPAHDPQWIATLSEDYYWSESSADGRLLAKSEPDRIVVHDALTGAEKHSLGEGTGTGWSGDWRSPPTDRRLWRRRGRESSSGTWREGTWRPVGDLMTP